MKSSDNNHTSHRLAFIHVWIYLCMRIVYVYAQIIDHYYIWLRWLYLSVCMNHVYIACDSMHHKSSPTCPHLHEHVSPTVEVLGVRHFHNRQQASLRVADPRAYGVSFMRASNVLLSNHYVL